jgi:Reeler domain/Eukaryotic cytochrome b561/DOMON domain
MVCTSTPSPSPPPTLPLSGATYFTLSMNSVSYSAGQSYTITVDSATQASFTGVILYATVGDTTSKVGTFAAKSGFRRGGDNGWCSSSATTTIGHSSSATKTVPYTFTWFAPAEGTGTIKLRAIVVRGGASVWSVPTPLSVDEVIAPPTFTSLSANIAGSTSTTLAISYEVSKPSDVYCAAVADNAAAPSAAQIKAGSGGGIISQGFQGVDVAGSVIVGSLVQLTAYDVYCVAEDSLGNLQATGTKVDATTPDTTPPTFSGLSVNTGAATSSSITVTATTSENSALYCMSVLNDATAPTAAQVKAGSAPGAISAASETSSNTAFSLAVGGLNPATDYDVYCVAEDIASNLQASPTKLDAASTAGADTSAPTFLSLSNAAGSATSTSLLMQFTSDEPSEVYCIAMSQGSATPSVSEIKSGSAVGAVGSGSQTAASSSGSVSVTGLSQLTTFNVYCVAEDPSDNIQAAGTRVDATTPDTTPPTISSFVVDDAAKTQTSVSVDVTTNEASTLYCVTVPDAGAAPTSAQVKAGSGGVIISAASVTTPATTFSSVALGGLTVLTDYDVYCVAEDTAVSPNLQASPEKRDAVTAADAPPTFTSIESNAGAATSVSLSIDYSADEPAIVYCAAVADAASAPSLEQIRAGSGGGIIGAGSVLSATQSSSVTVSGLTQLTAYDVYCTAKDANGNQQASSTKIDASTPDTTAPVLSSATARPQDATVHSVSIDFTAAENVIVYCAAVPTSGATPTSVQIKAGSGGDIAGAGQSSSTPATSGTILIQNRAIQPSTSYNIYCSPEDTATSPNLQATPTLVTASTASLTLTESGLNADFNLTGALGSNANIWWRIRKPKASELIITQQAARAHPAPIALASGHLSQPLTASDDVIDFAVRITGTGYVAVGFSPDGLMPNSYAVIAQFLGGVPAFSIKEYFLSGRVIPSQLASDNLFNVHGTRAGGVTSFFFTRPVVTSDYTIDVGANIQQRMVWARGSSDVLQQHALNDRGSATVNFENGFISIDSESNLVDIHAFLMVFAFVIVMPIATLMARYRPVDKWFIMHAVLQTVAILLIIGGLYTIMKEFEDKNRDHGGFMHATVGFAVAILSGIQWLAGIARPHKNANAETQSLLRHSWEILHKTIIGKFLIIAGLINVFLGLDRRGEGQTSYLIVIIFVAILCGVITYAEIKRCRKTKGLGNRLESRPDFELDQVTQPAQPTQPTQ